MSEPPRFVPGAAAAATPERKRGERLSRSSVPSSSAINALDSAVMAAASPAAAAAAAAASSEHTRRRQARDVAVAKVAPAAEPELRVITKTVTVEKIVEKTVLKDIPNNVTGAEMEIWLSITARRRFNERIQKLKAQSDGRYFG